MPKDIRPCNNKIILKLTFIKISKTIIIAKIIKITKIIKIENLSINIPLQVIKTIIYPINSKKMIKIDTHAMTINKILNQR